MNTRFRTVLSVAAFVVAICGQTMASISFGVNFEFSGGVAPAGPGPWGTVTFTNAGANQVDVTFTSNLIGPTEFFTEWDINFDPSLSLANLAVGAPIAGGGTFANPGIQVGPANQYHADGDGFYDIEFDFATGDPSDHFDGSDSVTYHFTYSGVGTMTENSFNFISQLGPNGGYHTAAHIQGTGGGGQSGWNGDTQVPAPGAALLGVLGFGIVGWVKRRLA